MIIMAKYETFPGNCSFVFQYLYFIVTYFYSYHNFIKFLPYDERRKFNF